MLVKESIYDGGFANKRMAGAVLGADRSTTASPDSSAAKKENKKKQKINNH
jgi:hypothetical protein